MQGLKLGIHDLDNLIHYLKENPTDNGGVTVNRGLLRTLIKPRVLVTVSGGIAFVRSDPNVEVVVFDWDNYHAARDGDREQMGVPKRFAELAEAAGVPVLKTYNHMFTLCFSVPGSTHPKGEDISDETFYKALLNRIEDLRKDGSFEEALGYPNDTYEE